MKRFLSLTLSVLMIISAVFGANSIVFADDSVQCGNNIVANYSASQHTLTLTGSGAMNDYTISPWVGVSKYDITDVIIGEGITTIGNSAFAGMLRLENVSIPNTVISIGKNAFSSCKNLQAIHIPASVREIGTGALRTTGVNLKGIIVDRNNKYFADINGILFDKSYETLYVIPAAGDTAVLEIPNTVKTIVDEAAYNCVNLKEVVIPESVTVLGAEVFTGSKSAVEKITILNAELYLPEQLVMVDNTENLTIVGYANSTAEKYANALGIKFESIYTGCIHKLDNGKVMKAATCKETGTKTYTCTLCGESFDEVIAKIAHQYDGGKVTKEATCKETGTKTYTCTLCGESFDEVIAKIAHQYDGGKVTKKATCKETGTKTYTCTLCGESFDEVIAKIAHQYDGGKVTKEATCKETGTKTYTCTLCGESFDEVIAKIAHQYDGGKVTKKATCKVTGVKTYTCKTCGATKTSTIAKTGHTYKNTVTKATLTKNGKIENKCTVCGNVSKTTSINSVKTIKLNRNVITMNGTVQRPTVTVTDSKGKALTYNKDFTVSYSNFNSKNVGRYTVTVKLIGNYSGSKTFPYYINPKPTEFVPSNKGGFKAISKGFTLKWNKQNNQTTGYQIQYATKRDFSNAATITVANPNTTSYTIKGRAASTRYYVRVRTYKKIGNGTFYSNWNSGTKSVVTLR